MLDSAIFSGIGSLNYFRLVIIYNLVMRHNFRWFFKMRTLFLRSLILGLSLELGETEGLSLELGLADGLSLDDGETEGLSLDDGEIDGDSLDDALPANSFIATTI